MENRVLNDILKFLEVHGRSRQLTELHLTRFFTTVELDDGSVGSCMSYYRQPDDVLDILEAHLQRLCADPFAVQNVEPLRTVVSEHVSDAQQCDYVVASLMASIASALSAPIIRKGGDEWFLVGKRCPENWAGDAETALVVGFGGFLKPLVTEAPRVKHVHVIDFYYYHKSSGFAEEVAAWEAQYPEKRIIGSTHVEPADLKKFDLISITGSALCNGTLEYFLNNVRRDAIVILQGQSGSMHPKVLFEAGVNWVATTLKPKELTQMARGNHNGSVEMRALLQGGLPWVYLLPRSN